MTTEKAEQLVSLISDLIDLKVRDAVSYSEQLARGCDDSCAGIGSFSEIEKVREQIEVLLKSA